MPIFSKATCWSDERWNDKHSASTIVMSPLLPKIRYFLTWPSIITIYLHLFILTEALFCPFAVPDSSKPCSNSLLPVALSKIHGRRRPRSIIQNPTSLKLPLRFLKWLSMKLFSSGANLPPLSCVCQDSGNHSPDYRKRNPGHFNISTASQIIRVETHLSMFFNGTSLSRSWSCNFLKLSSKYIWKKTATKKPNMWIPDKHVYGTGIVRKDRFVK